MKISSDLNIWDIGTKFNEEGSVTIENFLEKGAAEEFHSFVAKYPETWWFQSTFDNKEVQNIPCKPENTEQLKENWAKAQKAFLKGGFTYNFDWSMNHFVSCECAECLFKQWLKSEETQKWISNITNEELTGTGESFISRFKSGQFLSPHHDKNKGKIGFVYNTTKDWKPEYGGMLHIMEEDYKTVNKVVMPKFNQVTIFHIPKSEGIPHFVSHVVNGVSRHRLSFTGWFS
jgi:Rps23 Pro-64 3,4-dihydroxylase Tpa1-like proline 4-hydroxylase